MKRPEGFDPASGRPRPQEAPRAGRPPAGVTARGRSGGSPGGERKQLRAASRERRRYEKQEIRRFTRRARNRRLGWTVAIGLVLALSGLLAAAVYSPLLALRTISVVGTSAVSEAEVHEAIDGQLGTPLALLDYERIRGELDAFPLLRSFVTEVVPPHTLVVRITERTPVGMSATASGFAVVDAAGVVLSESSEPVAGVPLIDIGTGRVGDRVFGAVVRVLEALPDSIRSQVETARASSQDDVTLVLAGVGQRVVWGDASRSALKARVLADLMASQGSSARLEFDVSAPLTPVVRPG